MGLPLVCSTLRAALFSPMCSRPWSDCPPLSPHAQVALGMAKVSGGEVMYDQRLFNQDQGMTSGFGAEDSYGVYDKALFTDRSAAGALYRPKNVEDDGAAEEGGVRTEKFKPDKGFKGADVSARGGAGGGGGQRRELFQQCFFLPLGYVFLRFVLLQPL